MSATWTTILGLFVLTALIRASGPLVVGGRILPAPLLRVVALVAAALLAALVVVETFTGASGELTVDARAAGLAAAGGVLLARPGALLSAVAIAALVAAALRAL